uniref:Uncharacterized protein n=1 Tax=Ascaris lumbricoides TaxID=6252 RepID=A0A0M3HRE6_ASCLU
MVKPLVEFVASLHKNRTDDRTLQRCCQASIRGDVVSIRIEFNEEGQYGLDIYTSSQLIFFIDLLFSLTALRERW